MFDRLKAAYRAIRDYKDGPVNDGHRYTIRIGETNYYADAISINKLGQPIWFYEGHGYKIVGIKLENFIIQDFEPKCSKAEFLEGKHPFRDI